MRYPALVAALLLAWNAHASELAVEVWNIRSGEGTVKIAIWDDAASFPENDLVRARATLAAEEGSVVAIFYDIGPGEYAVATYHDENGNDEFDRGFLGLPLEGYAFSNDLRPFLKSPPFEAASFAYDGNGGQVRIRMVY